jgi:hypothetical protein
MKLTDVLNIALDSAFVAVFLFTLADYWRHREPVRRAVVLVFGTLVVVLGVAGRHRGRTRRGAAGRVPHPSRPAPPTGVGPVAGELRAARVAPGAPWFAQWPSAA